jgi:subtilisin family serine protease
MQFKLYYLGFTLLMLAGCKTLENKPQSWQEVSSSESELHNSGEVKRIRITKLARPAQEYQQTMEVVNESKNMFEDYRTLESAVVTNASGKEISETLLTQNLKSLPVDFVLKKDDGVGQVYTYANRFILTLKEPPTGTISLLSRIHQFELIKTLGAPNVLLIETTHKNLGSRQDWKNQLKKESHVEYIEDDNIVFIDATYPNDPSFALLWGMNNTGQTGGTLDADIDAPEAWDLGTGQSTVTVGVIDTGVDYNHPDLQQNMYTNSSEIGFDQNGLDKRSNSVDDDNNGYVDDWRGWDFANNDNDPMDDHYHGTHVAGTIGAVGNDNNGISGTVWAVQLVALKFLRANGSGSTADAVEAVNYAANMGFDMTNNSWGGGGYIQALSNAINANLVKDALFLAAAGNSGRDNDLAPYYPSSYDLANVISVAATDHNDQLANFSNYGKSSVDIAAPGVSIYSTRPGTPQYMSLNGTSMATPHVSGVAALIKSEYPSMSFLQVKSRIFRGGEQKSSLVGKTTTEARINAYQSLLPLTSNEAPVGSIVVFGGPSYLIPDNWQLCDGAIVTDPASPLHSQAVPDLRNKFIMGASEQAPSESTGGVNTLKPHAHQFVGSTNRVWFGIESGNGNISSHQPANRASGFDRNKQIIEKHRGADNPYDSHGHMNGIARVSGNTSQGGVQDNRPAYTALHYIMRIK